MILCDFSGSSSGGRERDGWHSAESEKSPVEVVRAGSAFLVLDIVDDGARDPRPSDSVDALQHSRGLSCCDYSK